jgi:insulysin
MDPLFITTANYSKVALVIFKYIHLLKSTPPQEQAFREIKALADIAFRFVERGQPASYVSELTTYMQQPVPPEKTISSQWVVEKFDAKEIAESLAHLDVRRARLGISAKHFPDKQEPLSGTE